MWLDRAEFEAALIEAVNEFDFSATRFCRMLASGRCPRPILLRYAQHTYRGALLFCAYLGELAEQAPDPQARLVLLENLLEEEGIHLRAGRGLVSRPDQRHPALAQRFLEACGGEPGAASSAPVRGLLAERRWLEAAAFLLIGQELRFSSISGQLFDLFRKLGFAERDLAFFAVHVEADEAHGRQALDLVIDRAQSAQEQQACIAAARDGSWHWFAHHGASRPLRNAA